MPSTQVQIWKQLKNIRKKLVKKVTVSHVNQQGNGLVFHLTLKNFWTPLKKISVTVSDGVTEKPIPYKRINNHRLTIHVPEASLKDLENRLKVQLFINGHRMWITASNDFPKSGTSGILLDGKYIVTRVDRFILLYRKFAELKFHPDPFPITGYASGYSRLVLKTGKPLYSDLPDTSIQLYAFQNHKLRILDCHQTSDDCIEITDFTALSLGTWRLFLQRQGQLFPLVTDGSWQAELESFNHVITLMNQNGYACLSASAQTFKPDSISFKMNKDSIQLTFSSGPAMDHRLLQVEDTRTHEVSDYPINQTTAGSFATLPIKELTGNFSIKRFFIVSGGEAPIKRQFSLERNSLSGDFAFNDVIDCQLTRFNFYVHDDGSLALKAERPVIRKRITEISEFKLSGYAGKFLKFTDCKAYLLFEERESLRSIRVPVDGNFEVDLKQLDLPSLKSKNKTIIDLYIEIINSDGQTVRKEKIRYSESDYRKDHYYDSHFLHDAEGNIHYYLVTTTPFHNTKIETFAVPATIELNDEGALKDRNVWLVGERTDTAQDNGLVLYQWLREHTDVEAYYVLEKDSKDYKNICEDPNVLEFGSQKHYDLSLKAGVLLGTHDLENLLPFKTARGFFHYEDTYKVFLQHGVLGRKNVEYHKKFYDVPFDLFIVSSDEEKEEIVMEEMGYEYDEVAVTGLARFDRLVQNEPPKDILLMPTWRDWINTDQQFLESEYFSTYVNLINNPELNNLLREHNVRLNFYPHYRAQDFFERNIDIEDSRVNFITFGSRKVQDLLIEHALLITDYSTVSFDFIKMKKPVIHYHFDVERFFRKGILRPIEDTFIGRIAQSEQEIVDLIKDRLLHDFDNYEVDITGVIKYPDHRNCERIYHSVLKGLEQRPAATIQRY
ncbi:MULTISPECIES: CDP-glycerol glycerophosphotransferase family protein [Bhargavaea]|uniref:CDP-glycerol glycerophosphotransferase family protein n=1 Tax=Bhargavaea changchunensis TaxID=2134037 RepID=A0ABW2NEE6_9BACL|nr:CDP-glycerol glycerophosphotransferase family protein [Bhargavaea sp. CC-171006]